MATQDICELRDFISASLRVNSELVFFGLFVIRMRKARSSRRYLLMVRKSDQSECVVFSMQSRAARTPLY